MRIEEPGSGVPRIPRIERVTFENSKTRNHPEKKKKAKRVDLEQDQTNKEEDERLKTDTVEISEAARGALEAYQEEQDSEEEWKN